MGASESKPAKTDLTPQVTIGGADFGFGDVSPVNLEPKKIVRAKERPPPPPESGGIALQTLGGAFVSHSQEPYVLERLVVTDDEKRKYINVRYPPKLIRAVHNLASCVIQNELHYEEWSELAFAEMSEELTFKNYLGDEVTKPISKLMNDITRATDDSFKLWWLDTESVVGFSSTGTKDRVWLEKAFDDFRNVSMRKNDTNTLFGRSFAPMGEIIFNVLQVIQILETNKLHENLQSYIANEDPPPRPTLLDCYLVIKSDNEFKKDCTVDVKWNGTLKMIHPWGLKISVPGNSSFQPIKVSHDQLDKFMKDFVRIPQDIWRQVPAGSLVQFNLIPEDGCEIKFTGFDDSKIIGQCVKPSEHRVIDFNNREIVPDPSKPIVFARTFGKKDGIHHYFPTPIQVKVEPGHIIVVKNVQKEKNMKVTAQETDDLYKWMHENGEDRGTGYGQLNLIGKGEEDENYNLIFKKIWDSNVYEYTIEQLKGKGSAGKGGPKGGNKGEGGAPKGKGKGNKPKRMVLMDADDSD